MTIKINHTSKHSQKPQSVEHNLQAWLRSAPAGVNWEGEYELIPGVCLHATCWLILAKAASQHGITLEQAWHMCAAYFQGDAVKWEQAGFAWVEQDEEFNRNLLHMQKLIGVQRRAA